MMITLEADVVSGNEVVELPNGTKINRYSYVSAGAQVGDKCTIGEFCIIDKNIIIGHNTVIESSVCFSSRNANKKNTEMVVIGRDVVIQSNSTIITPCIIGDGATISAGSVILSNVPAGYRAYGVYKGCNDVR
jgi:UDP-3-O-[3-hydroxymyristoyl] glucosamine N-acyltransferase